MKILLFPRHETSFQRMFPQYETLSKDCRFDPFIILADQRVSKYTSLCDLKNIKHIDVIPKVPGDPIIGADNIWDSICNIFPKLISGILRRKRVSFSFPVSLWRFYYVIKNYKKEAEFWLNFLQTEAPDIVFLPGDRELGFVPPLLWAARKLNIKTIISAGGIPSVEGIAASRQSDIRFKANLTSCPLLLNLIAAFRFPKQEFPTRTSTLLFSPGWLILALAKLDMLPDNPWVQGGGYADFIFMSSDQKAHFAIKQGLDRNKALVIGDAAFDALFHAKSICKEQIAAFNDKFVLSQGKKLIVFAIPNYAEHNILHWDEHLEKLREFSTVLSHFECNVICSLHPKSDIETYRFLESDFGFHIETSPLATILPCADVFLCGNSSTIEWAIILGLPIINLDYIYMNDENYEECPSLFKVTKTKDFKETLLNLLENLDHYTQQQIQCSAHYGILDGKFEEHLKKIVLNIKEHCP
ncbi:hypothetical protein [Terasakiella sp. SH-1]|uniref:hypothetical protein n=1 Tax=Terasakiella sp. SH-1 TaxID=2560057 RepID=UPI001073C618|nr:hypothetical protein [Terasakiella sp. SH-1]